MKTKDIGCEFCNKFDFSTASVEIKEDGAYIVSGLCNTRFPTDEQFNFCPICGKQIRKDKHLKEVTTYCFRAKLEYLDKYKAEKGNYFFVPFQVLAEDIHKAEKMLWEWLSKPEQTGYKFKQCVGIIREASNMVILND